jgi:hypothetical protein
MDAKKAAQIDRAVRLTLETVGLRKAQDRINRERRERREQAAAEQGGAGHDYRVNAAGLSRLLRWASVTPWATLEQTIKEATEQGWLRPAGEADGAAALHPGDHLEYFPPRMNQDEGWVMGALYVRGRDHRLRDYIEVSGQPELLLIERVEPYDPARHDHH